MIALRFTESAWVVELNGHVVGVASSETDARRMAEDVGLQNRVCTPSWRWGARADGRLHEFEQTRNRRGDFR